MGAQLIHHISLENLTFDGNSLKVKSLAVNNQFGQSAYKAVELYEKHGLDAKAIIKAAKAILS